MAFQGICYNKNMRDQYQLDNLSVVEHEISNCLQNKQRKAPRAHSLVWRALTSLAKRETVYPKPPKDRKNLFIVGGSKIINKSQNMQTIKSMHNQWGQQRVPPLQFYFLEIS